MPELNFTIEGAEAIPFAATPLLSLKTRMVNADASVRIRNVFLQCQIQIEPARRRYAPQEQAKLRDLFGQPSRWSQTLRPILWANSSVVVPAFENETLVGVSVPCTFDFNVAATKYVYGLEDGEIPVCVLYSGTIFHTTNEGPLQIARISWDREANYRVPVRIWKEMMEMYYPNSAWLCLQRRVFDRFYEYKIERGIPTWEQALESLLARSEENEIPAVQA